MASSGPDSNDNHGALVDITVKTLDGQNRNFNVPENLTVRQFKEKISSSIEIPSDTQRLIYQGRVMQDEKALREYDVHGKAIHVVQRAPPSSLTGQGSTSSTTDSTPRRTTGPDTNLLDVQIHVGRVQGGSSSSSHGARCRIRQADFNLGLVNDALDLLEERTNITVNDCPPPDYNESVRRGDTGQEDMDIGSESEIGGARQAGVSGRSQTDSASSTAQNSAQAPSQGQAPSGTEFPSPGLTTTELADFLDRVLSTNSRITPHLRLYRNYLRNEQSFSRETQEGQNAQEVVDRVTEALHAMSHLMHNLSDVMVDMSSDAPRTATAGPPPQSNLVMPGATSVAIPIQMNVRARHGANGRQRPRNQAQGSTTSSATASSTATSSATSSFAQATAGESTTTGSPHTTEAPPPSTPAGNSQPQATANFSAGPMPGIMQATVDIAQGFRLPPGAINLPLNLPNIGEGIMMVVNDIHTAEGHLGGAPVPSSTPAPGSTPGPAPGAPGSTGPPGSAPTSTSSSTPNPLHQGTNPTTSSASVQFGPTTTINIGTLGGPGGNIGNLPNVPGLPAGMLQNILGSVLATHGVQPGQPVRVNMVQQTGHRGQGQEQRGGMSDIPLDDDMMPGGSSSQTRADASQQTPQTLDAGVGMRSNAATNTSQSSEAPGVNAATNTSASGPTHSTFSATQNIRASVGTHTDPSLGTSSRSTNTPQRPAVHIHRGSVGTPAGIRPTIPAPFPPGPGNGGGRGYVDMFLPCSSSHYNSESVRRVQRSTATQNQQNMVPNLSTMVSGLVGDIIEQVGQGMSFQAINTGNVRVSSTSSTSGTSATSTATSSSSTARTATTSTSAAPFSASQQQASSAPPQSAPPPPPINPMEMLAGLMGSRGPAGSGPSPGGPVSLDLGSLLSGIMNPGRPVQSPGPTSATGSSGTLAELISQFREAHGSDDDPEAGLIVSLMEAMAVHIHLTDLLLLTMGNTQVLHRIRMPLQHFVDERMEEIGSLDGLVETALNDVQPNIRYIESLVEVRDGVDMAQSLRGCLQHHFRLLFTFIHHNPDRWSVMGDGDYGTNLYRLWMNMMAEAIAICIYCIKDGQPGFSRMLTAYMPRLTQGMNPGVTGYMTNSLQDILSSFHRNHPVPESQIMKYVVNKPSDQSRGDSETAAKSTASSGVSSAPPIPTSNKPSSDVPSEARNTGEVTNLRPVSAVQSEARSTREAANLRPVSATPMEVTQTPSPQPPKAKVPRTANTAESPDVFVDASETLSSRPTAPRTAKPTTLLPSVAASSRTSKKESNGLTNGESRDNSWQSVIPQEWIPVITQDTVRQQNQRPQPPMSDAYIQGLPAKRRRMMGLEHAGEMGNMAQYLPASLSRAARAAGAEPISSEENMLQEASENSGLHSDLEREVQSVLEARVKNDQDYSSDRFPKSDIYFHKSRRH